MVRLGGEGRWGGAEMGMLKSREGGGEGMLEGGKVVFSVLPHNCQLRLF